MSKLKDIRISKGMTQEQLAEMSGISATRISNFETGQRDLSKALFKTLSALAKSLGVSVEELIDKTV